MMKLFCSRCSKPIKDITLEQAQKLTGEEICSKCEKAVSQVEGRKGEIDATLEALQGKHSKKFFAVFEKAKLDLEKVLGELIERDPIFGLIPKSTAGKKSTV